MVRQKKRSRLSVPSTGMNMLKMAGHSEMFGIELTKEEIENRFKQASIGNLLPSLSRLIASFHMDKSNQVIYEIISRSSELGLHELFVNYIKKI